MKRKAKPLRMWGMTDGADNLVCIIARTLERISGNYMNGLMAVMRGATDGKSPAELAAIARASLWQEGQH